MVDLDGFCQLEETTVISSKQLVAKTFATASLLSWFFILTINFEVLFQNITTDKFWIFAGEILFFIFAIASALIGVHISERFNRRKLLTLSITLGILSILSLTIFHGETFSLLLGSLLGLSFGLGFPSAAALFSDHTQEESRGKITGFFVLITFTLITCGMFVSQVYSFLELIIFSIVLSSLGYLSLTKDQCSRENREVKTWFSILSRRNVRYYLIPWIIFNLVSGLSNFIYPGLPNEPMYESAINIGTLTQFIGVAIFSIISGFICDRFGRRLPIIIGVLLFGISFGILSVALDPLIIIFQSTIFGVAWGFCMVAYFVIPADLAESESTLPEKYFALINISSFVVYSGTMTLPIILGFSVPINILSPILSILLFSSIIPLYSVSETLSETIRNSRKIRKHTESVVREVMKSKNEK